MIDYKFCPVCGKKLKICKESTVNYGSSFVQNWDCSDKKCGIHIKKISHRKNLKSDLETSSVVVWERD